MTSRRSRSIVTRSHRARRPEPDGSLTGPSPADVLSAAHAVTERTRKLRAESAALAEARNAVEGANQRFEDLYDFVPIPYVIASNIGTIEHVNERAVQFFGGARQWLVGRPLIGYVESEDMRTVLDCLLSSSASASQSAEVRLRACDGVRIVQLITRRCRSEPGSAATFHIAIVDLTEVRRLDEERRLAQQEQQRSQEAERVARAASGAKDEFLAMLSHELRTPLTPILAAADSLVSGDTLADDLRTKVDIIRRNVKAEARLIDDLLDVARITKRTFEVNLRPIDLHRILSEILDGWGASLAERQIALDVRLDAREHHVQGDAGRIGQVLRNLLSNAAKFTDSGGRITVTSKSHRGSIRVTVTDTGAGMTEAQMAKLFKPFEPAGGRTARHGLGLGLIVSHAIVEAHQGTLEVWSAGVGSGTTVRMELPTIAPPPVATDAPVVEATAAPPTARVLLVEDDGDSAEMLAMLLSLEGFRVERAVSIYGALKLLDCCDILVSDIALPDGNGVDLMHAIRATGSSMRAVALSGCGSAQDIRRSLDAGFEEHLVKPVDLERLVEAVRRLTEPKV